MSTIVLKNNTAVDVPIPDVGVTVPASSSDTYTDDGLIRDLSASKDLRTFLTDAGPTLTLNDGVSDLTAPRAFMYLATLWDRAGFDTDAIQLKTVELDFGALGTRSKNFVIVDTDVSATAIIQAWQSGMAATGRSADENEMDRISFAALPAAGSFTLYATALFGPVSGLYKVHYLVH